MIDRRSKLKKFGSAIFSVINTSRKVIVNLFFFTLLFIFIMALSNDENEVVVPEKTALLLNLNGEVVEQMREVDPMDAFMREALDQKQERPEILLADIIEVIEHAKHDDRIQAIVLKLNNMTRSGLTKSKIIAQKLEEFKSTGKKVIAYGSQYTQDQYYIASQADNVWLDPDGWFLLDGYGRYQMYFKSALDKLNISQHVFRVGTYKSAVEPYMRDDMSEEAKEANIAWLNDLWNVYKQDVAQNRNFEVGNFDETTDQLLTKLKATDGDVAKYALDNGWVDELLTSQEVNKKLIELVGKGEKEFFSHIAYKKYLKVVKPIIPIVNPNSDKVAVVVAKGTILNGTQKPGTIGGQSTAKLLRKARQNDNVKAVVLRVDSPGGSAYASEVIRREVELLKAAGKPVVASMGTYAASGGYWISASADKIYAAPTTITGSIGIFGFFMTFENTLKEIGVSTDGVGTTELAGFGVTRPLSDGVADIIQMNINKGYKNFLKLVANGRNMSVEEVDSVAQGRVWSGAKAKELGLVDELGNLDNAVEAAAELAGLTNYDTLLVEKELSPTDKFMRELLGTASTYLPVTETVSNSMGPMESLLLHLKSELKAIDNFNDPNGMYLYCLTCEIK